MSAITPSILEIRDALAAPLSKQTAAREAAPFIVLPENYRATSLEKTLVVPYRMRGNVIVSRIEDFVRLVSEANLPLEGGAVVAYEIFASAEADTFTAILNWWGWRDYRINLSIRKSVHFQLLSAALGEVRGQKTFVRFLEDFSYLITHPEAAAMIDVAKKFKAVQNVKFVSIQENANGNCHFEYIKTNEAGNTDAKGSIQKVPEEFEVTVPIYEGEAPSRLTVRLTYDITEGKLVFGLAFHLLHVEVRRLADARMKAISEALAGKAIGIGNADEIKALG
jgi:uncharacterized protein YfdQ (DUF2303 family)